MKILLLLCSALLASAQGVKQCSAPPEHPHARLNARFVGRRSFSSGEKVHYSCAEDRSPSRGSRAAQCVEGAWTRVTLKCDKRSCGNAGDLPNGHFLYEGNSFFGERVYAVCNDGFAVKGLNYLICKKSGWTGEFPTCGEGRAACSGPVVANSVRSSGNVSVHQAGDNVTFTCARGFQLDGARQVTCGPGGRWQPQPPRCRPSEASTDNESTGGCDAPPTVRSSNAHLAAKYVTVARFASGARVQYACDVGHAQAGGSRYRTCKSGRWTPLLLKCELKACGSAGEILHGHFTYTGVDFGDTAAAVCDEGYILVGRATRRCMSGGWDGRVPVCEAVVCDEPPPPPPPAAGTGAEAEREEFQEPPFAYRSVVRYRCREGTLVGPREVWCTAGGTWSAPPPQCKEVTCPSPNVPRAFWTGAQNRLHRYRDTISMGCEAGFALIGPSAVTCGRDGRWSPGLPTCGRAPRSKYWRRQ
ncbi:putative complement receptor type 1-like [Scophthalmus maximus]|uniref:Putative complement receptor type 1-like n=1 Tax=Scophthalmus maximus TaxID=52904 RepID=A0A2U9C175_SCOMX|nr:putative complement receptor type 1-like [Scophthalmus maximus]